MGRLGFDERERLRLHPAIDPHPANSTILSKKLHD